EPELVAKVVHVLAVGFLLQHELDGVAGEEPGQGEDDERGDDQRRDRDDQALEEVASEHGSAIKPRRQEAAAPVVAEIGPVILHGGVPHPDVHAGGRVHVILLLGRVALDLVEDLAPLGHVRGRRWRISMSPSTGSLTWLWFLSSPAMYGPKRKLSGSRKGV